MRDLARRFHWPLLILDLALAVAVAVLTLFVDGEPAWVAPILMALLGVLNALIAKTDRDFAREVNAAAYELGQIAPGSDIARIAEAVAALLAAPPYAVVASSDAVAQALIDEPALYARLRPRTEPTPVVIEPGPATVDAWLTADGTWDVFDPATRLTHHGVTEDAVALLRGQEFVDRARGRAPTE